MAKQRFAPNVQLIPSSVLHPGIRSPRSSWRRCTAIGFESQAVRPSFRLTSLGDVNYSSHMFEVRRTDVFSRWIDKLRDDQAIARILTRIQRLSLGNFGDVKSVGDGVSELRIDYGPGYRVYFTRIRSLIVLLLIGGTKQSQQKDIERAKALIKEIDNAS